jgi:uridine phosphorylase
VVTRFLKSKKVSSQGKFQAADLIESLRANGRLPKYKVPTSVILYFGLQPAGVWSVKMNRQSFFGATIDLALDGHWGVLSGFGIGAPSMAFYVELLVALGVRQIVGLGQAGGLSTKTQIGDTILVKAAVRDEGLSDHYGAFGESIEGAASLTETLRQFMIDRNWAFIEGSVWSTDALFRETPDEIDHYSEQGVLAVEMETSALFALGHSLGFSAASLLIVSDDLSQTKWRGEFGRTRALMHQMAESLVALRREL